MRWFEVRQEQEDLWSVSSKGRTLYLYSSEEEARQAALRSGNSRPSRSSSSPKLLRTSM